MNKEQLTITADCIKKYGDNHFDLTRWFQIDAHYLMDNKRIEITDYSEKPFLMEQMPFYNVYDLNHNFEIAVGKSKYKDTYDDFINGYLDTEVEEVYEQLCVKPFEVLNELDIANCNTTACIAGWAVLAYNNMTIDNTFNETIANGFEEAGESILELNDYETGHLFNCQKNSAWDLVAARYNLEEKALELAKTNYDKQRTNDENSLTWDNLSEDLKEGWYFQFLGSLITSTIAYEVLMDIVNGVIDISGIYAEYSPSHSKMDIAGVYSQYTSKN